MNTLGVTTAAEAAARDQAAFAAGTTSFALMLQAGTTAARTRGRTRVRAIGGIRGGTLEEMFEALPLAWRQLEQAATYPPMVLADLPSPA